MFDTSAELMEHIQLGEDSLLELKEVRFAGEKVLGPTREKLADELASFANARGGVLVLGVDDSSRELVGIPIDRLDLVEAYLREVCDASIKPPLAPTIERLKLPNATGQLVPVLKVEVERSLWVHQSPGGYFHRVGSSKCPMAPDFLARLFQQRSQTRLIRFDEQVVFKASLDDLTPHLWERFRGPANADAREVLLSKLSLAGPAEGGVVRPTVAGILMATDDPRRFLPNAFIQAVAYSGTTPVPDPAQGAYQVDAHDLSGPIDAQVVEALKFVKRNMRIGATKRVGRVDLPQFDLAAVFEALVNAVAHRDYSIHGSKIRLRLFSDRLELSSPGALPNTMTTESIRFRQAARNEVLTSLLARCRVPADLADASGTRAAFMDKRGEGVPIIEDRTRALSGKAALYTAIDESELLLTLPAAQA